MKRSIFITLAILTVMALSVPVVAVPRLQTYIVDSQYALYGNGRDVGTWITRSSSFDLKVVGHWAQDPSGSGFGTIDRPMYKVPAYDYMDCYLAMSVPRDQMGQIFVNGVEISAFDRWVASIPGGTNPGVAIPQTGPASGNRFSFLNIGRLDNDQINAHHYGYGRVFAPGWGDELTLDIVVRGFDWAHFDAIGVDSQGRTFTNSQFHDSSFYATPEPSTLSLLGLGLLGIAPLLRKKKR